MKKILCVFILLLSICSCNGKKTAQERILTSYEEQGTLLFYEKQTYNNKNGRFIVLTVYTENGTYEYLIDVENDRYKIKLDYNRYDTGWYY